jgi:hypothetical protein
MGGFARRGGHRIDIELPPAAIGISHSDGAYGRGSITSRRTHMERQTFGATPAEVQQYGNLNLWQSLMLLQKWAPLLKFGQAYLAETDPYKKAIIVADGVEWLASQTKASIDDELVQRIAALLKTQEGEALVRWVVVQAEALR